MWSTRSCGVRESQYALSAASASAKELKTEKAERSIRGSDVSICSDSSFIGWDDCITRGGQNSGRCQGHETILLTL